MSRPRAIAELVAAALIWGFGFVATSWALAGSGPIWLSALRFTLAAAVGLPIVALSPSLRGSLRRDQLALAAPPGFFLAASLILQTAGLKYTTATNNGFITTLYVLFVPIIARLWARRRVPRGHTMFVFIALVGTALICRLEEAHFNIGDALTLACAVLAALHIFWLSEIGARVASPFAFNVMQSIWAGLIGLAVAIPAEAAPDLAAPPLALGGLAFLIAATMVSFFLQVRAQRVLPAALASLLCLIESPAAALFAFLLLGDRLTVPQWLGAALILAAAAAAVRTESRPA